MEAPSVLRQKEVELHVDPKTATDQEKVQLYQATVKRIYELLLYEVDLRTITKGAIDGLETDLRLVIKGVSDLTTTNAVQSTDALQKHLVEARNGLYNASDTLENKGRNPKFYDHLTSCSEQLKEALRYF